APSASFSQCPRDMQIERPSFLPRGGEKKGDPTAPRSRRGAGRLLEGVPVLVIDDDALSRKLLAVALGGEGCEVRLAPSAEEAFEVLRSFHPRVIIVDLILPLMSGLLFTERVKANPSTRDIVVIAVSAFNGREADSFALAAGCVALVRKPLDPIAFAHLVARYIGGAP